MLTGRAGYSVKSYEDDEAIPLYVNKLYSDNTQLQYAYYDLPFVCPPSGKKHAGLPSGKGVSLNLGEVLRGDRIMTSDYDLIMGQDKECEFLCSRKVDRAGVRRARKLIEDGYVAEWIVDNLPGATSFVTVDRTEKYYAAGFKVGSKDISANGKPVYYINNHLTLVIRWRAAPGRAGARGGKVIVGFEVYTKSVGPTDRNATECPIHTRNGRDARGMELHIAPNNTLAAAKYAHSSYLPEEDEVDDGATLDIPYSYSVYFREDTRVDWANRWDLYFRNQDESARIHWLAIANALVIAGLLTAVVAMIWNRTGAGADSKALLLRDGPLMEEGKGKGRRARHPAGARSPRVPEKAGLLDGIDGPNDDGSATSDDESSIAGIEDVTGWKLLHADVFRAPTHAGLLAPLIGSGSQLLFMALGLLVLSCLGVLNPSFRGGFVSVGMGLFVFAGIFAGYYSGRVYKTFGGSNWRKNTLMVSAPNTLISREVCRTDRAAITRPPSSSPAPSSPPSSSSTSSSGPKPRRPPCPLAPSSASPPSGFSSRSRSCTPAAGSRRTAHAPGTTLPKHLRSRGRSPAARWATRAAPASRSPPVWCPSP